MGTRERHQSTYRSQEALRHETCSCVQLYMVSMYAEQAATTLVETYEELHLRYLLVHLLHELYDEIHKLMLQHLLGMVIRDQERDIITLAYTVSLLSILSSCRGLPVQQTYRHRLPPQHEERLRSLCQESCELMHEDMLDLIRLFYPNANSYAIDRGFH